MYSVKPIGINTKNNDSDVPDGSLLESINMQWREGSFSPIPERIITEINVSGYTNIILHKVGDENTINCLGFDIENTLIWFGTITDGVYTEKAIVVNLEFAKRPGMSFTILNGLIYLMGDGSSVSEQFYFKLDYSELTGAYTLYDMYKWKSLIPFYPYQANISLLAPKDNHQILVQCGVILIRYALVLKSGEVVLHSPIYGFLLLGLNRSSAPITKDTIIKNIHCLINMDFSFADTALFDEEISAINIYATTPYYETKLTKDYAANYAYDGLMKHDDLRAKISEKAEELFYLIKTIDKPTDAEKLLLTIGLFDTDIELPAGTTYKYLRIGADTIAAGEIMPVDNFSYHKVYGKITSYNGRLVVKRPVTVLSGGYIRALATLGTASQQGFKMVTEDGDIDGISYNIDKSVQFADDFVFTRGILSYPDTRANLVGANGSAGSNLKLFRCRKNARHNMSCALDITYTSWNSLDLIANVADATKLEAISNYSVYIGYTRHLTTIAPTGININTKYSSENRLQFSQAGEFKVWPAINSYRIGEGKLMNLGVGSVNPSESQIISPIIVGTTDGIYTINLDPSGENFIASITRTRSIPMISEEILEIDNNILFVSDQGLMVFSDGDIQNITSAYFPQQGTGNYPTMESVFSGYNLLTLPFFGEPGNIYTLDDIIKYMRGSLMAFDGRRNTIWCSNPAYPFSLIYNLDFKQWGMSTLVFNEKQEFFSILTTDEGEIYSRYMVKTNASDNLLLLSGEDPTKEVFYHLLTRPVKFQNADDYKVLPRMISRSLLKRSTIGGYLSFGLWGSQEVNKYKKAFALALKKDDRAITFPGDIRYHIPVSCRKGKYKTVTVLQAGKGLPESYISSFDFDVYLVDNNKMR
jgi:hypothetical protein